MLGLTTLGLCHSLAVDALPDLRTARIEYRRDLLAALLPEKKAHREALLALERSLAEKADYPEAIHVRDERIALDQEIAALEHEIPALKEQAQSLRNGPQQERTLLLAKDATISGLTLDAKTNVLTGWTSDTASARWSLPNLPPGGYEILVNYACPAQTSAILECKESFYTLRSTFAGTDDKPVEINMGTLRLRDGGGSLTLDAPKNDAGDKLRIISVALVPANK